MENNIKNKQSVEDLIQDSIVHIYNHSISHDHIRPWKIKNDDLSTATGFCVEIDNNKYILTNAHCMSSSALLQIQAYGSAIKYLAKVKYVMPACDLALLYVEDEKFWLSLKPVIFIDDMPAILQTVYVVGYPMDGSNISFTQGVVSRIITTDYVAHGYIENIAIQIDAAINNGNSGGPVINDDGQVVGIAFQSQNNAENMGEIIPTYVYKNLFLPYFLKYGHLSEDEKELKSIETPELGFEYQIMENPDLREYYKMTSSQTGILVTHIPTLSSLKNIINVGDIIMAIDKTKIESNGTVLFPGNKKVYLDFDYVITNHPPETECELTILRDGVVKKIKIMPQFQIKNLKGTLYKSSNQYLIIGGIVFIVPTIKYNIQMIKNKNNLPCNISTMLYYMDAKETDSELVIASCILPCEANIGYSYSNYNAFPLLKFNDQIIRNLKHLSYLYDNNKQDYIKLEFGGLLEQCKSILIMNTKKVKNTLIKLLKENLITSDRSENLI